MNMKNKYLKLRDCIIATPDVRSRDYFFWPLDPKSPYILRLQGLRIQAVMQFADSVFVARALPEGGCKIISIYPREALDTYSPPLEVVLDSGYQGNEVTVTIALCC